MDFAEVRVADGWLAAVLVLAAPPPAMCRAEVSAADGKLGTALVLAPPPSPM